MNRLKAVTTSLIATAILAQGAAAQVPASPKELGMAGAFVGVARGYESLLLAPGNLGLPGNPRWSVALAQVGLSGSLRGPRLLDLRDYIDFDEMSPSRQDELLSMIPSEGTGGSFGIRAPLLAVTNGGFGFSVGYSSFGGHTLSRDLAELFLEGYEDGRTDYAVGNTFGERATTWNAAASYGWMAGPVSVGATGHYIRGGTLMRSRLFEPRVYLEAQEVSVDYVGVLARGGRGYAMDVGAAYMLDREITLSATITNLLSRMTWSEDLRVRSLTLDRDMIDNATPIDLRNRYVRSERALDQTAVSLQVFEAAEGLYDEAYFPTLARVGVAWQPAARTHIAADLQQKMTAGRIGEAWDQRLAVGAQQGLGILGFRIGYSIANDGGNMFGGGISLGALDVGVARYQQSRRGDERTSGWVAAMGLGIQQPF